MESRNGASSSTGHFLPVPVSSDDFQSLLSLLESAYLFEESKHSFNYSTAFLAQNSALTEKYNACREKRKEQGYTDEDLKETYGFLLFNDLSKAKSVGETGVLTGNETCTTLGDSSKGVYLSMYSDCLDLNRWYHGKSGYIVILRLTPGKVKRISENYTENLTCPTEGFDCHVSEQLPSVSSKTSSFLAFERTQYYLYEMLDNGSTAQSPSLACPYGVIAFSYTNTKETKQEKCKEKKVACPYSPWMGILQVGSQTFNVGIRSTAGALTWAKVPPVIKAEQTISLLHLRKLLPKTIFDTASNGKGLQEDLACSLFEIYTEGLEEKEKLTPLLQELKEKDVALIITLSNGGYLVLIHTSNFIFHDNGMTTDKVLQGVFVFPVSQAIQRVAKNDKRRRSLPSDALRVLPLLTYAEGEIVKTNENTNEDLCETFVRYMQSHATLISPGVPSSPFREVSIFPDQYDVPDAHGHLYSSPEWTDKQWQSLKCYLNNAKSFQLPVCKASEIFVAGQESRREDLEDDVYICLSSPEEPSTSFIGSESEDRQNQDGSEDVETTQNTAQPVKSPSQIVPNVLTQEAVPVTSKSTEKTDLLRPDEPSEELIVRITSATNTIGKDGLDVTKHDQLLVTTELQTATLNSLSELMQGKMTVNCSDDSKLLNKNKTAPLEQNKESTQSPSLQIAKTLLEKDQPFCMDSVTTQGLEKTPESPKKQNNRLKSKKTSPETTKVLEGVVDTDLTDSVFLKELETCTLKKKSERWGLKPVISTCGRIFIPFGSVDTDKIKSLQKKVRVASEKMNTEEKCIDALSEVTNASEYTETSNDKDTIVSNEEEHPSKHIDHIDSDKSLSTTDAEHKENHTTEVPTVEKSKGESMLKKLKCVILKKRNTSVLRIGLNVTDDLENGPVSKRTKTDLKPEAVKNCTDVSAKEIQTDNQTLTTLSSVDPVFAQALGLTPKDTLDVSSGVKSSDIPMESDLAYAKENTSNKQQCQSSPKALGSRFKMLKKNQSISAEQVKKKWWLHFQTPTCYAEKLYEGCSRDNSVSKTVKEKSDTSSEALNLLADLALSADKEQVSPHPIQVCLQEFGSSLKNPEITKDVSNPEQQSVLHALLRQPASKNVQPHEMPSPEGSFEGSELVDVICQEHAYSLPSSPSLLLALPAPFQVSPLNGSFRLMDADGAQTMHAILSPEEKAEISENDPGHPESDWDRRQFCQLRTIVNKDTSVQVTRHWEGSYDFNLDSRFTVADKDKSIVRALHGPWNFSLSDTTEELQLIVHMWIGLFYSRSTARFFHLDSDLTLASSEDISDPIDVSNDKEQEQKVAEPVVSSSFLSEKTPEENLSETVLSSLSTNVANENEPEILDLSKPRNCVEVQELALNLSQRPSDMEKSKHNPEPHEQTQVRDLIPQAQHPVLPFQWYWNPIHTAPLTMNQQLYIPIWSGIPNTQVSNNVQAPTLPTNPLTADASCPFPKSPESMVRKRVSHRRGQKHPYPSPVPRRKESREKNMQQVKENLPNITKSADLNSAHEDVDTMKSKHLFEIKNKYLEKLASINQQPTFQHDEDAKDCNILKKLLQRDTPKPLRPSECEILPSQHTRTNISSHPENSSQNKNVIQSVVQHLFAFPKASSTSIVTETTCENRNDPQSFNIAGLSPFASPENEKCSSTVDSTFVPCIKEKEEPAGHCVGVGPLLEFANQDINVRKQDILAKNTTHHIFSQEKRRESVEALLEKKCSNDETQNSSRGVAIPFIGLSTPIEDMFKKDTSNEMDTDKCVEDMEIASPDSSPHIEVSAPLPTDADSANHDQSGNHKEKSVAESEINLTFDGREGEVDDRCPTPTIDEQPYVYTSQSCLNYRGNDLNGLSQDGGEKETGKSSTPVLDENSVKASSLPVYTEARAKVGPQSDVELRTLRTLQCLDEFLSTLQNKSNPLFFNSKYTLNTSVASNKNSSSIIYDFRNMEMPTSASHSTQKFSASSSVDVLGDMQQPEEKCPTLLLPASDTLTEDLSKPISSTEKPEQTVGSDNEKPTSNISSHQCSDMTERPSDKDQGQMNSVKQMSTFGIDRPFKPIKFCIKRTKQGHFVCSGSVFDLQNENCDMAQPIQKDVDIPQCTDVSSTLLSEVMGSVKSTFKHEADHDTDSRNKTSTSKFTHTDEDILKCITTFVDSRTNKIKDNSLGTEASLRCTVTNTKKKGPSLLEKVSKRCLQEDSTQSSLDRECLIFVDRMKQLLKGKNQCLQVHGDRSNLSPSSPIIVQFSHLEEQDDVFGDINIPMSFFNQKISVDMTDREHLSDVEQKSPSQSVSYKELEQSAAAISAITAECARVYKNIMNKICSGHGNTSLLKDLHKTDSFDSRTDSCNNFDFCSQMKKEVDDSFRNRLNSVVKKSCKTKNRFFLLVTSEDPFFNETREHLEAEGHISVLPSEFFQRESSSSPLLVVIRNEDIAEHIFEVPHLLQLRRSRAVQFAGIDEPDDVVNLTYQEIFINGGFVMFDRVAVESLSSGDFRKILEIFQKLMQTGKWKWVLHYRDSRRFKENARSCPDAKEKTTLLNKCREDGLLEILPYHECDLMSRDEPNYLQCLCRQQVQNISTRYPVFVTDSETTGGFEKSGVVTMTVNSFLMESLFKIVSSSQ